MVIVFPMQTTTENPQDRFNMAWTALGERLVSGAESLRLMAPKMSEQTDTMRLIDKAAGVEYAIDLWDDFNSGAMQDSGDFAGMWRTFTDQMLARLTVDGLMPGYYQGIYLALDYQRGYGEDVDAPRVRPRAV